MQVTGTIKLIGETQTFGENGFRKRELVITTNEQYPQTLMIEFTQDRAELLNNYTPGQQVSINIDLRGREWVNPEGVTKYINSIRGWNIQPLQQQVQSQVPPQTTPQPANVSQRTTDANTNHQNNTQEPEDDLPF